MVQGSEHQRNRTLGSARPGGHEVSGKLRIGHDRGEVGADVVINGRDKLTRSEEHPRVPGPWIISMANISVREITKAILIVGNEQKHKNENRVQDGNDRRERHTRAPRRELTI